MVAGLPDPNIPLEHPLGHRYWRAFRILYILQRSGEPASLDILGSWIPENTAEQVADALTELIGDGLLHEAKPRHWWFAPAVPAAYIRLVQQLGGHIATLDPRYAYRPHVVGARATTHGPSLDGAPHLFGPDVRLRNLMALAKYGPMDLRDVHRVSGTTKHNENTSSAPFGRGSVTRVYSIKNRGNAVALDPDHPVAEPLRALLLKLESAYPLPPLVRRYPTPPPPPRRKHWAGDSLNFFGSAIPTAILTSIGPLGWTYEGLCCLLASGYDRVVVKKVVKRLEGEGVLQAGRPRGPGFNVRVLTIADDFVAKDELLAVLRAYDRAFGTSASVRAALEGLPARAQEHLRRRDLWPKAYDRKPRGRTAARSAGRTARGSPAAADRK